MWVPGDGGALAGDPAGDALGTGVGAAPLIAGTTVSFAVAYASVAWLLNFVTRHSFHVFVAYRMVVGVLLFGLLGAGGLS